MPERIECFLLIVCYRNYSFPILSFFSISSLIFLSPIIRISIAKYFIRTYIQLWRW